MTDEVKDASGADAEEQQEQPTPAMPSADLPIESSEQPSPDVGAVVEAAVQKAISGLDETLDKKVDSRFKSGKDVRYSKVEEIYDWVQAAGGDVNAIKQDVEIAQLRDDLRNIQSGPTGDAGPSPPVDSDWTVAQAKTDIILQNAGIASDDPEYNVLVAEYRGKIKPADWPDVVETFTKGRRGGSPANVVGEAGGTVPASADIETIAKRLHEATLTGAPTEEIKKLQEQLIKARES